MPRLEPKDVQKELDQGWIWPVYWLHGGERMKARELVKRIRVAALGESGGSLSFNEETLDGNEASSSEVLDAAQSLSLGGGVRFILVREAHALKEADVLAPLLGARCKKSELPHVVIFLSKDLDGRKKFSKLLMEKAACVPCEEIADEDREPWIGYLSKRKGITLTPGQTVTLRSLDPWNLDIIEQELEKLSIFLLRGDADSAGALLQGAGSSASTEAFIESFFRRDLASSLTQLEAFVDSPDQALPLLGLLAWNVRHLAIVASDREQGSRNAKLSPFLAERFSRWTRGWSLEEVVRLQQGLAEVDFQIKQTQRLPVGIWTRLVTDFCRP
jgi:DNA polymerase-3 subunit delta